VTQHRLGRSLAEILEDNDVRRCGSARFCWSVIRDPRTIAALEENLRSLEQQSL
jgi:hypothetical protein